MRHILVVVFSAVVLATGTPGAFAKPTSYQPKVSLEKARKIALERVPGTVLDEELEKEDGRWIYSFDIRPRERKRKIIKEVHVDPETGKILDVETERSR